MRTGITPVNDTIVVLECGGGGWSGVDLVGDGELEGMVLGEHWGAWGERTGLENAGHVSVSDKHQEEVHGVGHPTAQTWPCVGPDVILSTSPCVI